jgi:Family of unknown function (DUF6220)
MSTLTPTRPEALQPIATPTTTSTTAMTSDASTPVEMSIALPVPRHRAAAAFTVVARILLGGVALQIFFAGLGVFGVSSFLPHMILGPLVILGSLVLPLIAWRGHLRAAVQHRAWLIFALMLLQGLLIDAGRFVHLIAAFHPVNAMLLALLVAGAARTEFASDAR